MIEKYKDTFLAYAQRGLIELVDLEKEPGYEKSEKAYYLPHRAVIKESTTTSVRSVFDASSPTGPNRSLSLNDSIHAGPKMHTDIMSGNLNFRFHNVVIVGDIEKMFLNIEMREEDRPYQRFL